MDRDGQLREELDRLRAIADERRRAKQRASDELQLAGRQAVAALRAANLTPGVVEISTGLKASRIRKLTVGVNWRPGSLDTYQRLDAFIYDRLGRSWDLAELRKAYRAASEALDEAEKRIDEAPLVARRDDRFEPGGAASGRTPPAQLPRDVEVMRGRSVELAKLRGWGAEAVDATRPGAGPIVTVLDGKAGVGKSALAINAAHALAREFPDGTLYADLRGDDDRPVDPAQVLRLFLHALGASAPDGLREAAALYRTLLAERRVLVVLDNAANSAQLRPLLPAGPGCFVIVTSRSTLDGLDAIRPLPLDVLKDDDARALLVDFIGARRSEAEPEQVRLLTSLCGRLPLALCIAGARLRARPAWKIGVFTERLRDEQRRLGELAVDDCSVLAAFLLSYRDLPAEDALMFRWLALLRGLDAGSEVAARVAGIEADQADASLERLVGAHLLESPAYRRYRYHELFAVFARDLTNAEDRADERQAALGRAFAWYLERTKLAEAVLETGSVEVAMDGTGFADRAAALAWLEAERANLLAAAEQVLSDGPLEVAWQLAYSLFDYFDLRKYWPDWRRVNEAALEATRLARNPSAEATVLNHLGVIHREQRRFDEARRCLAQSLAIRRESRERAKEAVVLMNLGLVDYAEGRHDQAIALHQESLAIHKALGDRAGQAQVLVNLGNAAGDGGRLDDAVEWHHQALALFQQLGDRLHEAVTLNNLATAYRQQQRLDEALDCLRQSLPLRQEVNDEYGTGLTYANLGNVARDQGRAETAHEYYAQALDVFEGLDDIHTQGKVRLEQGELLLARQQHEAAIECLGLAQGLFHRAGDRRMEGLALRSLGHAVIGVRGPAAAKRHWSASLALLEAAAAPEAAAVRTLLWGDLPAQSTYDLGVLVLPGVGKERLDDALGEFGDALAAVFSEGRSRSEPPVEAKPAPAGDRDGPPRLVLERAQPDDDTADQRDPGPRWLVAISPVNHLPADRDALRAFLRWLRGALPVLAADAVDRHARQVMCQAAPRRERWPRLAANRAALYGIALLLMLTQTALYLVQSALRLPGLRGPAEALAGRLMRRLGLLYMQARSPTAFKAQLDVSNRDLVWLRRRCRRVAIVAHGDNVAVADELARRNGRETIARLVTLGSSIHRVRALGALSSWPDGAPSPSGWLLGWLMFATLVVATPLVCGLVLIWVLANRPPVALAAPVAVAAPALVAASIHGARHSLRQIDAVLLQIHRRVAEQAPEPTGVAWLDLASPADLVADGPYLAAVDPLRQVQDYVEVTHQASLWSDRRAYVRPLGEALLRTVAALTEIASAPGASTSVANVAADAADSRRRVRWLKAARWVTLLAGTCLAVAVQRRLAPAAAGLRALLLPALWVLCVVAVYVPVKRTWFEWDRIERRHHLRITTVGGGSIPPYWRDLPFGLFVEVAASLLIVSALGAIGRPEAAIAGAARLAARLTWSTPFFGAILLTAAAALGLLLGAILIAYVLSRPAVLAVRSRRPHPPRPVAAAVQLLRRLRSGGLEVAAGRYHLAQIGWEVAERRFLSRRRPFPSPDNTMMLLRDDAVLLDLRDGYVRDGVVARVHGRAVHHAGQSPANAVPRLARAKDWHAFIRDLPSLLARDSPIG